MSFFRTPLPKNVVQAAALGALSALLASLLWAGGALDRLEFTSWDWRERRLARPGLASSRVKLILLDQASLDWATKENRLSWPWPREMYTTIVDFCRRAHAKTLTFDVLFTEPSSYGVGDDRALAKAMQKYGAAVLPLLTN